MDRLPPSLRAERHAAGSIAIWIGGVLILLGLGGASLFVVFGVGELRGAVADAPRVSLATGGAVFLDDPGEYLLYASGELRTADDDADATFQRPEGQVIVSMADPEGNALPVITATDTELVTIENERFRLIGAVEVAFAGRYQIATVGDGGGRFSQLVLTREELVDGSERIVSSMLLGAMAVVLGLFFVVLGVLSRSRSRRSGHAPPPMPAFGTAGGSPWPASPPTGPIGEPPAGWAPPPQAPTSPETSPPVTTQPAPTPPAGTPQPPPPPGMPTFLPAPIPPVDQPEPPR